MTAEASTDLCELFARVVKQFPHNLAVDHPDGRLTYRELDEVSSILANDLRSLHVSEGCPVLLLTAHGTLNIVAILAILKTGGFFIPIDRNTWSPDAIRYVFDTVDSQVAVNTTPEPFTPPDGRSYHVLHLSQLPPDHHGQFDHTLPPVFRSTPAERTACTIFTSGSTGRAKGVMISHRSLALYAKMSPANLDIQPGDRLLHLLSVAFDASTCILFSALLNGGTVVPAKPDQVYDLSSSCTVMASTPSLLNHLPRPTPDQGSLMYARMHSILLGGETCTSELLESWIDAGVRVWTAYGATETTSMGFIRKVERDALTGDIELAVIGKAMALSQVWLLDSDLGIVEDNFAEGEIVIGGEGVAQGYYKDETKTADAFIWWNGRRVYKTGDYGRWVPARGVSQDRVFEFRGRRDRTVKNRGFLVNLDRDVEDCLYRAGTSLGVRSVRAAMAENGIVAVVSPSWVDTTALLTQAKHSMYAYCIPYRIVAVDDFPLSPNGKAQLRNILDIFVAVDQARMDQTPNATIGKETRMPTDSAEKQEPEKAHGKLEKILRAATEVLRQPGEELRKIRPEQTFVEVGGSSLLALKLVSSLRQLDLNVSVRDLFACHTFSDIAKLASTTTLSKGTANLNLAKDSEATPELPRIPANLTAQVRTALNLAANEDIEVAPLTSLQLELAIPTLAETSRSVNQVRLSYKGVWAGAMERAWRVAWQSEPVFKAQICLDVGSGVQVVRKRAPKAPTREVFHSRQEYDTAVGGSSMAVGLGARLDFLVYQPPGVASNETSGTDGENLTIVLTVHHSLMDGCSLKLLLDKLEQVTLGWPFGTSPSPVHANLALISTQQSRDAEARAFFHSYLKDMPLPLPSRRSSAAAERQHHGIAKTALFEPSVDIDEVTTFASSHCVSAACVYYTAWAMAMSVFERCPQVVVGAVFSSRGALSAEHEDALGLYMSTLPLVFCFEDMNETVVARLQHTMGDLTTVGEYAWARSDQVGLGRNLRNLLSMQLPLPGEHSRPPAVRAESLENSDFPISMLVEANGSLRLLYDETQFDTTTVRRLGEHFKYALSGLIREHRVEDCMRISRLHETLFDHTERVGIESGELSTVKRALEEAMDQFADLPALEDCSGTTVLSYGELDRLTETITRQINALCGDTSQNNRPIAVHGDGSVDWVLGTLAVVRTGRTFVPLDPKWPIGRRAAVCEQSGATALILVPRASQVGEAPAIPGMRVLAVDSILSSSAEPSSNTPGPLDDAPSPDDLLTIVFTSGTTGAPKGVPLSHQGFLALQSTPEGRMFAAPGRRVAQFMSPAFDVCNAEMFSTLLHGATLVLRDPLDPFAHLARVNTASMTPSVLATLELDRFPSLEVIYATGEPLTSGLMSQFAERVLLYNAYGPAECIIWSSMTRMIAGDRLTIGTGLDTARMYVLDEDQHHSPDSTRGEIYVAGVQVLSSYINSPEQTAERIMPDPWHPGHRMYKTGDYGIRGRDGRIVFQGRIDRQVKIRGFRVELPGVEQAILSGPADEGISQCAAMAIHDTLVAFVALDNNHPDPEEERIARLRDRLADTLLPSWVPQIILPVEEGFPRTANDKADTRALEAAYASRVASHQSPSIETLSYTAEESSSTSASSTSEDNSSHIKDELATQWRRVLQLQHDTPIKDSDDFISLGGHSVLLMLLATRLSATFGVSISVRHLVTTPSFQGQVELVERLLVQVEGNEAKTSPEELKTTTLRTEDLTELERLVWFQCQVAPNPVVFNIAMVLNLQGTVDLQRLEYSLNVALASDPVVRSNFVGGPDGLRRRLRESAPKVRRFVELNEEAEATRRFDLETDELIRVYMVAPLDTANEARPLRLLIVTTHVIADLGTLQNLLQLASTAYSKTTAAVAIAKHERPVHLDLDRWTQHPSLEAQEFWKTYLGGHCYHAEKSSILPSSSQTLFQGTSQTYPFSGRLVTPLNALLRRLGVTHHQLALTAAALTMQWLSRKTGNEQDDIVLGAPHAGRSLPAERHHALGQFLDRLPVRVRLGVEEEEEEDDGKITTTTTTTTTLLTHVRDSAREALANAIPFSAILAALDYPRGGLRHPLFECMVTFHARGAGLENWMQLGPAPHGGGGGGGVSVTSTPVFVPGVAKFPLMLEWFERGGCGEADDNWMLHMELQDVDKDAENTRRLAGVLKDAMEIVLQAVADECSIEELRRRLDGLQLPDGMPWVINGEPAAGNRRDVYYGYFRPEVIELASKIRDEMLACLGDTAMGSNTQILARKLRKALGTSFFEAGADSNDALMLRHRLRERLGLDMSLRDVFVAQSPLGLAQRVLQ